MRKYSYKMLHVTRYTLHDNKGFTLIEVLIVVLVVLAILSIAITSGRNFNDSVNLENTAKGINSKIKLAKSRSISALNGTNHSIHFEADKVTVFEGSTFNASASTNEVFIFSDNIEIDIPTGLSGGDDLIFDRLVGSTSNAGSIDIGAISDPSKTKQIIVNSDGQTSLNSFQTSIEPLIMNARHVHFHLGWDIKNATTLSLEWVDPDNFDSHIITEDIDVASHLNGDQTVFDWTGTVTVQSVGQEIRIHSWLDGGFTVLCIIREQTETDKLFIYTDSGLAKKDIAIYEDVSGVVNVLADTHGGTIDIQ